MEFFLWKTYNNEARKKDFIWEKIWVAKVLHMALYQLHLLINSSLKIRATSKL